VFVDLGAEHAGERLVWKGQLETRRLHQRHLELATIAELAQQYVDPYAALRQRTDDAAGAARAPEAGVEDKVEVLVIDAENMTSRTMPSMSAPEPLKQPGRAENRHND